MESLLHKVIMVELPVLPQLLNCITLLCRSSLIKVVDYLVYDHSPVIQCIFQECCHLHAWHSWNASCLSYSFSLCVLGNLGNLLDHERETMTGCQWLTESLSLTHKHSDAEISVDLQTVTHIQREGQLEVQNRPPGLAVQFNPPGLCAARWGSEVRTAAGCQTRWGNMAYFQSAPCSSAWLHRRQMAPGCVPLAEERGEERHKNILM